MATKRAKRHSKNCKCSPDSPFLWANNPRPSIFASTPSYRQSEIATASVEAQRAKGNKPGMLSNLSRKSSEHSLATRDFFTYSRAKLNVFTKEPVNE
jgi:hypothetical protein